MRGNSSGPPSKGIDYSMRAFDTFPPPLREALRHSVGRYSGEQIETLLRDGITPETIIRQIALNDRASTARFYDISHPQHPDYRRRSRGPRP